MLRSSICLNTMYRPQLGLIFLKTPMLVYMAKNPNELAVVLKQLTVKYSMRLMDLLEGDNVRTGFVAGDDLVFSTHFLDRIKERNIPLPVVLSSIKSAAMRKKSELDAIPVDDKVVLRDHSKFGIVLQKRENVNKTITWILVTASPTLINGRGDPEIAIPKIVIPVPMNTRFAAYR